MPKIDLTGQRFGRLLVLREDTEPYLSPGGKPTRRWICRCDCGREVILPTRYLTSGALTSPCAPSRVGLLASTSARPTSAG